VIVASARAIHLAKNEPRSFGSSLRSQKPTIKALEEVLAGKLSYVTSGEEETLETEE
jgi:DNA-directed RNA polymerase subunit K/omega